MEWSLWTLNTNVHYYCYVLLYILCVPGKSPSLWQSVKWSLLYLTSWHFLDLPTTTLASVSVECCWLKCYRNIWGIDFSFIFSKNKSKYFWSVMFSPLFTIHLQCFSSTAAVIKNVKSELTVVSFWQIKVLVGKICVLNNLAEHILTNTIS